MFIRTRTFSMILQIVIIGGLLAGCSGGKPNSDGAAPASQSAQPTVPAKTSEATVPKPASKIKKLTLQAPLGITVSAPFYYIVEKKLLSDYAEEVELVEWKSPDEMRARITSGQADISALPTNVGVNLYNKGVDLKLINVLIWGTTHLLGPEGETFSWEGLRGKTVHVPLKGDAPDLMFRYLLMKNKIDPEKDLKIEYVSSTQELAMLTAAGRTQYSVLPEQTASIAVQQSKGVAKIMNFQEEWGKATGKPARVPGAGVVVSGTLAKQYPELVQKLQQAFKESVQYINANPKEAALMLEPHQSGLSVDFIQKLVPALNLQFGAASDIRSELEFYYSEMAALSPEIIGGKLPNEAFYYAK
ncbi:ABC transporter substrate-binding protein [Paenibacillus sp. FSL H8-0034]|uniref:ABC transporter substrate-binding protein n=1 Tax=Paenibacillus sp. FSL H8-0034 TaxID=2954671 RepID=UPI0030F57FEF